MIINYNIVHSCLCCWWKPKIVILSTVWCRLKVSRVCCFKSGFKNLLAYKDIVLYYTKWYYKVSTDAYIHQNMQTVTLAYIQTCITAHTQMKRFKWYVLPVSSIQRNVSPDAKISHNALKSLDCLTTYSKRHNTSPSVSRLGSTVIKSLLVK